MRVIKQAAGWCAREKRGGSAIGVQGLVPAREIWALGVEVLLEKLLGQFEHGFLFFAKELERLGFEVNQQVARLAPAAPGETSFGDADFRAGRTFVEQYFANTGKRRHLDGAASEYPEDANRDGDVDIVLFEPE